MAIPFKKTFNIVNKASQINERSLVEDEDESLAGGVPCAKMPFMQCMDCLIVKVCGSDWVCVVACGVFIPSCVGGAAATCIIF